MQEDLRGLHDLPARHMDMVEEAPAIPKTEYMQEEGATTLLLCTTFFFFFSLCQAFCTYPPAPPVGSPQSLHRLCLFIHFALPSVCCWLPLGKPSFTRGDDLGADSTLLWPGPETTSCTQLPVGSCTQLPMTLLLRHLLSALRDAVRCERPLSASAAVLSRVTYCFGERKVPN